MGNIFCCCPGPKPTYDPHAQRVYRLNGPQNYHRTNHASGATNRSAVSKGAENVPRAETPRVIPVQPRSLTVQPVKPTPRPPTHNDNQIRSGSGHRHSAATAAKAKNCDACGESDHTTSSCRYSTRLCFYCREEGHIIRICPVLKKARKRSRAEYFRKQAKTLVVAHPYQNYVVSNKKPQKKTKKSSKPQHVQQGKATPSSRNV